MRSSTTRYFVQTFRCNFDSILVNNKGNLDVSKSLIRTTAFLILKIKIQNNNCLYATSMQIPVMFTVRNINSIWHSQFDLQISSSKETHNGKKIREVCNEQFYDVNDFVWCENIIWRYNDLLISLTETYVRDLIKRIH